MGTIGEDEYRALAKDNTAQIANMAIALDVDAVDERGRNWLTVYFEQSCTAKYWKEFVVRGVKFDCDAFEGSAADLLALKLVERGAMSVAASAFEPEKVAWSLAGLALAGEKFPLMHEAFKLGEPIKKGFVSRLLGQGISGWAPPESDEESMERFVDLECVLLALASNPKCSCDLSTELLSKKTMSNLLEVFGSQRGKISGKEMDLGDGPKLYAFINAGPSDDGAKQELKAWVDGMASKCQSLQIDAASAKAKAPGNRKGL